MPNLKVSTRLFLSFTLLMLFICLLGGISILENRDTAKMNSDVANFSIPELVNLVALESAFEDAFTHMVAYSLTHNTIYYERFNNVIGKVNDAQRKASDFVSRNSSSQDLSRLKNFLDTFDKAFSQYTRAVSATHQTIVHSDKLLTMFTPMSNNIEEAIETYSSELHTYAQSVYSTKVDEQTLFNINNSIAAIRELEADFKQVQDLAIKSLPYTKIQELLDVDKINTALAQNFQVSLKSVPTREFQDKAQAIYNQMLTFSKTAKELASTRQKITALNSERARINSTVSESAAQTIIHVQNNLIEKSHSTIARLEQSQSIVIGIIISLLVVSMILSYFISNSITNPLNTGVIFAQEIAKGNLNQELNYYGTNELGVLAQALREMVIALKDSIAKANEQAKQAEKMNDEAKIAMEQAKQAQASAELAKSAGMRAAAEQLDAITDTVKVSMQSLYSQVVEAEQSMNINSNRITETASAMEEMNATVLEVARSAGDAANISADARNRAEHGASVVRDMVKRIAEVETQAQQLKSDMVQLDTQAESIGAIMNVISDIADQTNLLALNAAIEAARAGEAGRGFAVVADEVRKLAEKTMQATVEVGNAIKGVQTSVERNMKSVDLSVQSVNITTDLANQAGKSLAEIVSMVDTTADQVRTIATAADQQSATSDEINRSLSSINTTSSETAQVIHNAHDEVNSLNNQTNELGKIILELKAS